jgi:cell division transport system permease protein
MGKNQPKPLKRRLLNAYFVSTLSITLVLFLIGLLVFMTLNVQHINKYIRENIGFTLVLGDQVREAELLQLQKILSAQPEVKSAGYVDSETAAKNLKTELGEDFLGFLGYNPINPTIDVKLYSDYTHNDSLENLEQKFLQYSNVEEVYYQRNLVSLINENSHKIGIILIGLATIMLLIFMALINNTIRLSIYSNRFIINTMQLVGATHNFVRKPFVGRAIVQGFIGGILANAILAALILSYGQEFGSIINYNITQMMAIIFASVIVAGLLLSWVSTMLAVNKFLRLRYDELFY